MDRGAEPIGRTSAAMPEPTDVVAHLTPAHWSHANRLLVRKALAEFAHERLVVPQRRPEGDYVVWSDDGTIEYRFSADVLALEHWSIDASSITRRASGVETPLDALQLILDLRRALGLGDETLPTYLEEISSTLSSSCFKLAAGPMSAAKLSRADFQTVETRMTEGHPCFVANNGRLGFDAAEYRLYAPEAASPVRLLWVAARRDMSTFTSSVGLDYARLIESELGGETLDRFARVLATRGLRLEDFHLIPVHPWQWWNKLSVTFAGDIAARHLVCVGYSDDDYLAQQSIRTFFNISAPSKHYVKTALSVLNMGFMRGLSAAYMEATPAINDWLAALIDGDDRLRRSPMGILRERAAIGYHSPRYEAAAPPRSPYLKMLAALWRESPVPELAAGQRLTTMAALLYVDENGASFAGSLITRSGLEPTAWLRRYLDAYLTPQLHCLLAYDLAFMPHGENVILVLEDDVPSRVLMKDIAEEIVVMNESMTLPPGVERVRASVPDELKVLSVLSDIFDCFFRFLSAILSTEGILDEEAFWATVAACVSDYQRSAPHLANRFAQYDLFAERFPLSCLNRLQLRNNKHMVDLQAPADHLQFAGTLANPIAGFART